MSDTVEIHYSSSENITFRGTLSTDISREDWDQMADWEKDLIIEEYTVDHVQYWVEED